jgi:hypothetical protein
LSEGSGRQEEENSGPYALSYRGDVSKKRPQEKNNRGYFSGTIKRPERDCKKTVNAMEQAGYSRVLLLLNETHPKAVSNAIINI